MKTNILNNMINNVRVYAIMMVCLTMFSAGNAWGATATLTLKTSSGPSSPYEDANGVTWTFSSVTFENSNNACIGATSGTLTITPPSGATVTKISVTKTGNSWAGAAELKLFVGTSVTAHTTLNSSSSTTTDISITSTDQTAGSYKFTNTTAKNCWVESITITYTPIAQTITFDKQGGTFDDPSVFVNTNQIKEASGGAGITLPLVNPSSACAFEGWGFYGWATAAVSSSTTTAPTIVGKAGDTYHPSSSRTLYAVFAQGEYTKETSSITDDAKYLIVANSSGDNYIMTYGSQTIGGYTGVPAVQIDETSTGKYAASSVNATWAYQFDKTSSSYYIRDVVNSSSSNYMDITLAGWYKYGSSAVDPYTFTVSTGVWTIKSDYSSSDYYLGFDNSDEAFFAYGGTGTATNLLLYKAGTINYWSSPSCCDKIVGISESGSSHASMTFSETSVSTCGSGADDRKVTITVTPASGYSLFGSVKPVFTKTSGTVTATIGDLVDNGDGTFSYECQFAIDDSGAGTFAITTGQFTNYLTVCPSDLTLTGPTGDIVFITSTASKTVRSQEAFHVEGYGLTRSQELSFDFGSDDLNGKFAFKKANGSAISTDASGAVDEDIYVFYTPGSGSSDGLDVAESVTASVSGAKSEEYTLDTKTIIGRHLPANFVIAGKKEDNKWYAMPANMSSTTNPKPSEIIVDDINNPSLAYTAASNIYSMEGPTASNISGSKGDYIRFVMTPLWVDDEDHSKGHAPLFGRATGNNEIGKSGDSQATSDLASGGWWWKLVQTNTSITSPQDAKYTIYNHNNTSSLSLRDNAGNPDWGLFASGVSELRLIPAQTADVVEAYFVEWGTNGGVIEVDAEDISATKVKATFKGNSSTKSLSQTLTSGGKASIYDYTVAFDGIDLSAADAVGNILLLEWYEEDDDLAGVTSISVPKIITGNYTMMGDGKPSKTDWEGYDEVHVLPGAKLTANTAGMSGYGMTLKHLEIYQGATVIITSGSNKGTLTVTDLVLRNGWSRAGSKRYDVARLYIKPYESDSKKASSLVATNAYADWYIDFDQYYPIAVPWEVTIPSGLSYRYCTVSATVGHDKNIRLRYYDGEGRAAGTNAGTSNWKDYGKGDNKAMPAKLVPAQGYVLSAKRPTGKAFSIIRMTLTIPSATWTAEGEQEEVSGTHKNQVSVGAWGKDDASKAWYAKCWNYIANPYMAVFTDDRKDDSNLVGKLLYENGGSVRYATIPDTDFKGFNQVNINEAELKPSSGFLVQVASTCTLTFSNSEIVAPSAPMRYTANQEAIPEQEAYIRLSGENGTDQMGMLIGSDYTADYEINADLSKMIGEANIVKTWMRYTDMDMAYVAINEQLAREWIPVTVHIPAEGEYTYSLKNSSTVDELEGLYLMDDLTGTTTNLLYDDYSFNAEAGTNIERFAINAIVGERKVPTGADITGVDKNGNEPVKFIWHDKVFILHNNVIYDSTGKRVNVINK